MPFKDAQRRRDYNRVYKRAPVRVTLAYIRKLFTRYGLTLARYVAMLFEQHNRCKLCDRLFDERRHATKPQVDHEHGAQRVRGLLCMACNKRLGFTLESSDWVTWYARAVEYLK